MLSSITGFIIAITGVIAGILALLSDELKKNKRLKYILVAVLLAFSVYAMIGSVLDISSKDSSASADLTIPIAIDSTKGWQSTGFEVNTGDVISIKVVGGKWSGWRDAKAGEFKWSENDGTGFSIECGSDKGKNYVSDCPVKQANISALVGEIGSTKYSIGNSCIFQAASSGIIQLTMNDDYKADNYGVLAVTITKNNLPATGLEDNCGFRTQ